MVSLAVVGWYNRGNAGDQLMMLALKTLFSGLDVSLEFVDRVDDNIIDRHSGVLFGGGSILQGEPDVTPSAFGRVLDGSRPVFYMGIGFDTSVSETHNKLLDVAKVVCTRSPIASLPARLRNKAKHVPDLVYSLPLFQENKVHKQVETPSELLFLTNAECIPTNKHPHWMHVAWSKFVDETSQFLDETKMNVSFLTMCKNDAQDDGWAVAHIVSAMSKRSTKIRHIHSGEDTSAVVEAFSKECIVVTQRYHGIILSEMSGNPYVNLWHHNKLRFAQPMNGEAVAYHGVTKDVLHQAINSQVVDYKKRVYPGHEPVKLAYNRVASEVVEHLKRT